MSTVNVKNKSNGFLRFKKKLRRSAFIKSLIFGLSCGLASASAVILYRKMMTLTPSLGLYLPVGAGVAVVVGLIAFLILRPSDRKIARKLDHDLALGEKVQTMLAYMDEDGQDMLILQREDTDKRLMNAPARAVRYRHPWRHAFAPVLACALLTVAVLTPIKAVEPIPVDPEPPFELSSWQETALLELIEQVKASEMEAIPKADTVNELEVLLSALRVTDKEEDMKIMVITVITNMNRIIREHNSSNKISPYMTASEHEKIQMLAMPLDMLSGREAREAMGDIRESLRIDELSEPLNAYIQALNDMISDISETVGVDDPLYQAIADHATALGELAAVLPEYTRDWAQTQLDSIFTSSADALNHALYIQFTNKDVKDTAIARLMEIFEISEDELPEEEKTQLPAEDDESEEENKQDEEEKGEEGGRGEGNVLFGSDDLIYDPIKNEHVKYGDVINEYFAAVSEKIISGQTPDTLEQFISDYFATLYDGSEKETAN